MKTIQEYWSKLVAAGLTPNWQNTVGGIYEIGNAFVIYFKDDKSIQNNILEIRTTDLCKLSERIQLSKNGIDLVKLEWRKPTEQDVEKMCWIMLYDKTLLIAKIEKVSIYGYISCYDNNSLYNINVLLATHGRLAPTIEDFEEVYK